MAIECLSIGGVPSTTVQIFRPQADALVLIVPGNPGVARLYLPFAQQLSALGQGRLNIAVASHAGHAPGYPAPHGYFSLADQRAHHLRFLDALPEASVVHVIGHSIGAWLAQQGFDAIPPARQGRAILLFPTIERMADTPAGRRLSPLFGPLRKPAHRFAQLIQHLPYRDWLLAGGLLAQTPASERPPLRQGLLELSAQSVHNVLLLAREELATVVDLPAALLQQHSPRVTLYYGHRDPWNLTDMPDGVKARFATIEIVRDREGLSHSFMFGGSDAVAGFAARRLAPADAPMAADDDATADVS